MFKKLNSRFMKVLFATVLVLSLISCLTIGAYTSYIAVSDFKEKTLQVCKYYSNRLNSRLDGITGTITLASTQGLFDMIKSGKGAYEISEMLRYMTLGNNNITGATVVTEKAVHNARAAKVRLTENFGNDYRNALEKYTDKTWVTGTSRTQHKKDSLIYILPQDDDIYMLLSASLDSIFWDFEHSENFFLKSADVYILDEESGGIPIYSGSGKKNTVERMSDNFKKNREYIMGISEMYYFYKIPNSEAVLALYVPNMQTAAHLQLLAILFILIFAAVMVVFVGAMKIFVYNITHPLEMVCNEMRGQGESYRCIAGRDLTDDIPEK